MRTPRQIDAVEALRRHGTTLKAAEALGLTRAGFSGLIVNAKLTPEEKAELYSGAALSVSRSRDPAIESAMDAIGTGLVPSLTWVKTKATEDMPAYSVLLKAPAHESESFRNLIRDTIKEALSGEVPELPPRFTPKGSSLLVLDPSDVHIGKLSVSSETGYAYDASIAEHRMVEGCKALMAAGKDNGAGHVLLVIGNDIAHIDTPRRTTTSGTPQDADGSIFTIFRAAQRAYIRTVKAALDMGLSVQLIFTPSNHDWVLGYCIAETLHALYKDHPNVTVSDYAVSERHRKYVRYGQNIIGFTHGDGGKENDLPQIMLQEARTHMAECRHRYWYLHHYHHKIRKGLGIRPMDREKDHIAMTVMRSGAGAMEGDNVAIEYVRSPSPPDSWHDRQGYLNRQAVEAFIHCPERGQVMRLTEWF